MSKITKREAKLHNEALALVHSDRALTSEEREFILTNYHEGARHMNALAGAFFTPMGMARDLSIEVPGGRVIDLCAGIGRLAAAVADKRNWSEELAEIVCVELNPEYVEVGRRAVPEATWVCASAFDVDALLRDFKRFDAAIANPPFGRVLGREARSTPATPWRYRGSEAELWTVEAASRLARYGAFILPQESIPFRYSGAQGFRKEFTQRSERFRSETGILLEPGCGVDCDAYRADWRGVAPKVDIVTADFTEMESVQAPGRQVFRSRVRVR